MFHLLANAGTVDSQDSRDFTVTDSAQDPTDEALIASIQAKDPEALRRLCERYRTLLRFVGYRVLHNDVDCDDLLQDVTIEIWRRADTFDPNKGKPLGWIITLTRRRALDRVRKREALIRMKVRVQEIHPPGAPLSYENVESEVAHAEMRECLERAMRNLPPAQRQVLQMAYYRGLSQRGIAQITRLPLGTVKTRLELGMRKLAVALRGFEDLI